MQVLRLQLGKYKTQTGHISPYNLHKTYITNNTCILEDIYYISSSIYS